MIRKTRILIENFFIGKCDVKLIKHSKNCKSQVLLTVDKQFKSFLSMKEGHYLYISFCDRFFCSLRLMSINSRV